MASFEDAIRDAVHPFSSIRLVYLFGSRADRSTGPSSDFDVAVLLEPGLLAPELLAEIGHRLSSALAPARVDLVCLNRVPVELAYAVIAQGKLIYETSAVVRVEYEARVLGVYGDYLPALRSMRREILEGDEDGTRVQRYRAALGRTLRALGPAAGTGGKAS